MTIYNDKKDELHKKLEKNRIVKQLFNSINQNLNSSMNYDEIFKQSFIVEDKKGEINANHIFTAMKLIRDYTTTGKSFFPYFEKRWFNNLDIEQSIEQSEFVPDELRRFLIDKLSLIINQLNAMGGSESRLVLAESISRLNILEKLLCKQIQQFEQSDEQLKMLVEKFDQYNTMKLNDKIDENELDEFLDMIEVIL